MSVAIAEPMSLVSSTQRTKGNRLVVGAVAIAIAFLPLTRGIGPGNLAPADFVFALAILTVLLWAGTNGHAMRTPYVISVAIIVFGGLIAALAGRFIGAGLVALGQDAYLLLWAIVVANIVRVPGSLRLVLRVWCWTSIVSALLIVLGVAAGWDGLAGIHREISSRAAFTFADENAAGVYFGLSLGLVLATRIPGSRKLRALAVALLLAGLLVTGSLAGLLCLGVVTIVAVTATVHRRFGVAAAIAVLSIVAVAGGASVLAIESTHFFDKAAASNARLVRDSLGRQEKSAGGREVLIREVTGLYFDGPLIGRGPASTRSWLKEVAAPYPNEAHDDYLASIAERGIIGFIGLILLISAVKVRTTALDNRALRPDFNAAIPRAAWMLGAVASLAFVALTHEILHDRIVWTLLGIVAGVHAFGLRQSSSRKGAGA